MPPGTAARTARRRRGPGGPTPRRGTPRSPRSTAPRGSAARRPGPRVRRSLVVLLGGLPQRGGGDRGGPGSVECRLQVGDPGVPLADLGAEAAEGVIDVRHAVAAYGDGEAQDLDILPVHGAVRRK